MPSGFFISTVTASRLSIALCVERMSGPSIVRPLTHPFLLSISFLTNISCSTTYTRSPILVWKPLSCDQATYCRFSYTLQLHVLMFCSILKPGTPHFVYGPEPSICDGGHFYSTSQMQLTLASLVHSFVVGNFVTEIHHHQSRQLLSRIVLLYGLGLVENNIKSTGMIY